MKASLSLFIAFIFLQSACNRADKSQPSRAEVLPADNAKLIRPNAPVSKEQSQDLKSELEERTARGWQDLFVKAVNYAKIKQSENSSSSRPEAQRDQLAWLLSFGSARLMLDKAFGKTSTTCKNPGQNANSGVLQRQWVGCLVEEMFANEFKSAEGLRQVFSVGLDYVSKKNPGVAEKFNSAVTAVDLGLVAEYLQEFNSNSHLIENLSKNAGELLTQLNAIMQQKLVVDAPFIAESFFVDKRFVLTTSYAQGSVGSERMYNLENQIVKLVVNNGRLVVLREGNGLFDSENQVDLVLGAFPILGTYRLGSKEAKETFYQIDFSQPENRQFLVPSLAGISAQVSLAADVVVPKVMHAPKPVLPELGSGLYFDKNDSQLVLDQLVLVNGDVPVLSTDAETMPELLEKDRLRPTVRIVQGLFHYDESMEQFAKTQAITIEQAQQQLWSMGVQDQSKEGQVSDVPYFTSGSFLTDSLGRPREVTTYARKFDLNETLTWVISKNTPPKAIPVVKSAVLSYQNLFASLQKEGEPAPKIEVLTQEEFEARNRTEGIKFGSGELHAADPRVNMILWDESQRLGAAWATGVAVPDSGKVISADVMLSGTGWAKEGCMAYMRNQWTKAKEPETKNRIKGPVPSAGTRMLWHITCETALLKLGFYRPFSQEIGNNPLPDFVKAHEHNLEFFPMAEAEEANRKHDYKKMAMLISQFGGHTVTEEEVSGARQDSAEKGDKGLMPWRKENPLVVSDLRFSFPAVDSVRQFLRLAQDKQESYQGLLRSQKLSATSKNPLAGNLAFAGKLLGGGAEPFVKIELGSASGNKVTAHVDCLRYANALDATEVGEIGTPHFELENVKSAEDGALALLRSTLVHELGHTFGLRHNFVGSTITARIDEKSQLQVKLPSATDSFMDYNDYAADMEMGAMSDYSSPNGAELSPTFGSYDIVALNALYTQNAEALKFSQGPLFCSDRNVGFLNNCQRFDFGKNYIEFLLHETNMLLSRIANVQSSDFILYSSGELISGPLGKLLANLDRLIFAFSFAQHDAGLTSQMAEKQGLVQISELLFHGAAPSEPYLRSFPARMGRPIYGVAEFLDLSDDIFNEPMLAEILADIVRTESGKLLLAASQALKAQDLDQGLDNGYFSAFYDINLGSQKYEYQTKLLDLFASRIMVPAGKPVAFSYMDGGVKDGSGLKVDGVPLELKLNVPFFNHNKEAALVANVEVDDPQNPGSKVQRNLLARGKSSINQMIVDLALASEIAGGYDKSPSAVRLAQDKAALAKLLDEGFSCAQPATRDCYILSQQAVPAANVILNVFDEALALAAAK